MPIKWRWLSYKSIVTFWRSMESNVKIMTNPMGIFNA
jgi:hypothetical protein